jgi:hypothetical protein
MRGLGYAACTRQMRKDYILVRKSERKIPLGRPRSRW